jgi:hypothetical protein
MIPFFLPDEDFDVIILMLFLTNILYFSTPLSCRVFVANVSFIWVCNKGNIAHFDIVF